ncbi:hypothetical protein BDZ89DRAFT_1141811 [Hymenopellis radicata]|nr:hypothetical protein BDZ89DRAFT_1141811 [Hymenopellis radicata]
MSLDTTEFSDAGPATRPKSSTPPFQHNSFRAMISTALESKSFLIMEKTPSPTSPPYTFFTQASMASSIASSSSSIVFTTNMSQSSLQSSIPGIPDEFEGPPETFPSVFGTGIRLLYPVSRLVELRQWGPQKATRKLSQPSALVGRGGLGSRPQKHRVTPSDGTIPATSPLSDKFPSSIHAAQSPLKNGKPVVRVAGRGGSGSFRSLSTTKSKASMRVKSKPSLPSLSETNTYPPPPLAKDLPKLGEPGPSTSSARPRLTSTTTSASSASSRRSSAEKPKVVRYGGRGGAGSRPRHVDVNSKSRLSSANAPELRIPLKWKSKDRKSKSRVQTDSQSREGVDCIVGDNASEVSSIHFAPIVLPLPKPVPPPPQPFTDTAYDDPPPSPSVGTPVDPNVPLSSLHPPSSVSSSEVSEISRTRRKRPLKLAKTLGEDPYADSGNFVFVRASNATRREAICMSGRTIKPSLSMDNAPASASRPLVPEHVSTAYRKPSQRKELQVLPVTPTETLDVKEAPDTLDAIPMRVFPLEPVTENESEADVKVWVDDKFEESDYHNSMIVFSDPPSPAPPAFESEYSEQADVAAFACSPFSRPDTPFSDSLAPKMLSLEGVVKADLMTESQGFYISRDEKHGHDQHGWIGQWNRKNMREVLNGLREL